MIVAVYIVGSCISCRQWNRAFHPSIILTMNLSGAPNSNVITVTAELSQVQRKVITKFTDKNDVAFIEIRAYSVSYQLHA
jgi:hypothetical protein